MTYNEMKRQSIEEEIAKIKNKIDILEEEIAEHEERIEELENELKQDIDYEFEEETSYLVEKEIEEREC